MKSPSSEGSAQDAAWQWDGESGGGAQEPADVIGGGPRLGRRGLLVGAGALAAGGAVWALTGSGGDRPAPKPRPTALSGPTPLWTYRGAEAMTPERLVAPPRRPVYLSKDGLQVLDPAGGDPRRLLVFDPPPAKDWPSDLELAGKVVLGPEQLFTATSQGHIDARHLSDPGADWSLPLPADIQGQVRLTGFDDGFLYGYVWGYPKRDGTQPQNRIFTLRLSDRSFFWTVSTADVEQPIAPTTGTGGILPCVRSLGDRTELVVRDGTSGRELWTAPGAEDLRWCVTGLQELVVPDGSGGVRMLDSATGTPRWTRSPARGESWRALPPLLGNAKVYVPRDDGVVDSLDPATGAVLWSCRLPFLLDRRSRPLTVGGMLFVPGPAVGGVVAIQTSTGRPAWTFRDSGPGRDVWTLAADADHLYAGHDDVLHALPLT